MIFIYDGECPFCAHFAELLELKSGLPDIEVKNARELEDLEGIPKGYDMDSRGAILILDKKMLYGSEAISWICSKIDHPSDGLMKILSSTFSSSQRSEFLFPFLLFFRRVSLLIKGVPRSLILKNIHI